MTFIPRPRASENGAQAVNGVACCMTAIGVKTFALGSGQSVARHNGGAPQWVHSDHLGSLSLVTSADGYLEAEPMRYAPFGKHRDGNPRQLPTERTFTGQGLDMSTDLMYYSDGTSYGRYYDPALGRFIQADPITPGRGSQAQNRYAYAYNSPLKYTDPDGHCPVCVTIGVGVATDVAIDYLIARATGTDFGLAASLKTNMALNAATAGLGGKIAKIRHLLKLRRLINTVVSHGDEAADLARSLAGTDDAARGLREAIDGVRASGGALSGEHVAALTAMATHRGTTEGLTVLGHWRYQGQTEYYIKVAQEKGGTYFNLDLYDQLRPAEQRLVNQRFLDEAAERGDRFLLSTPVLNADSAFAWEVDYLQRTHSYREALIDGERYLIK
jgi:RHS repeat-associated protein